MAILDLRAGNFAGPSSRARGAQIGVWEWWSNGVMHSNPVLHYSILVLERNFYGKSTEN
jgi:hypothetical protein